MATVNVTIAAGESLSAAANVTGAVQGIGIPSEWTPCLLTFQISPDSGVTWFDLFDGERELAYNVVPGSMLDIKGNPVFDNKAWLKIRCGSRISPVAQTGQRQLMVFTA